MSSVKLVTFDSTGTLLLFRTPVFEKYAEIGSKFGVKADALGLKENFSEAWRTLNEEHPNFGVSTGLGWKNWWKLLVEKTFRGYAKHDQEHKVTEIATHLISFYSTKEAFSVQPGIVDFLDYLKTKPFQLGVISNYDPRLHQILEFNDLKKYFNFILTSYDFKYPKPDVRIFQEALRLGNCTSGNEAIHIGDNISTDYLGAKAAGLRAILIHQSDKKDLNNSCIQGNDVFSNFYDLKAYFQREHEMPEESTQGK